MTIFAIAFTSDTVCPWCYIGSRRLNRAIEIHKKTVSSSDKFTVTWHPYYLDPSAMSASVLIEDRIVTKNGPEMASGIKQRLTRTGIQEGIVFTFIGRMGHTRTSHRLIDYAGQKDSETQNAVAQDLFRRLFEADGDVTDVELLVEAAVTAGMDGTEVRAYLAGEGGAENVDREASGARERGIRGVPYVEVVADGTGRRVVDGAVDVGEWLEVFRGLKEGDAMGDHVLVARGA